MLGKTLAFVLVKSLISLNFLNFLYWFYWLDKIQPLKL